MRENNLLAPSRVGQGRGPKAHNGNIKTERINVMWGTDMTTLTTNEGTASIFFAIDHCSLEVIGLHAARRGTRFEALEPIRQGLIEHFGAMSQKAAEGLARPQETRPDKHTTHTSIFQATQMWQSIVENGGEILFCKFEFWSVCCVFVPNPSSNSRIL